MSGVCEHGGTGHGAGPGIVLVVEHDDDCRETISETLQDAGYATFEAADAEAALEFLLEGKPAPDVVLLEIRLPGMSGNELVTILGRHDRLRRIPVLLMSAGRPSPAKGAVDARWIAKPFDAEQLLASVNKLSGPAREPPKSPS